MLTEKNKNRIWTDCPECSYKHLTAAYALLSGPWVTLGEPIDPKDLLLARAWITYREYLVGYKGNLDLAKGCLAAVETFGHIGVGSAIREIRIDPYADSVRWEALFDTWLSHRPNGKYRDPSPILAFAHIAEALRECPALTEEYSTLTDGDLDTIIDAIQWLKTTYELGENNEQD